jgi:hypothetical protein
MLPHLLDNRSQIAVRLSGLSAGRPLPLSPLGIFLVLISVRSWVDPRAIVRLEGLGHRKNDIENRNRDLPACSIVPQITTLPRTTILKEESRLNFQLFLNASDISFNCDRSYARMAQSRTKRTGFCFSRNQDAFGYLHHILWNYIAQKKWHMSNKSAMHLPKLIINKTRLTSLHIFVLGARYSVVG